MERNQIIKYSIIATVVIVLVIVCVKACGHSTEKDEEPVDTTLVLVRQVQQCSRLYTAEVEVKKVVTHDDDLQLKATILSKDIDFGIPLGKRKIAIPMKATLKAYVDLSTFNENNIKRNGDKIEIILPDPKVVMTQTKINNEDIRKNVPFLRTDFTDEELTNYEAQGRQEIINAIPQLNLIPTAQEGAAKVLIPLLEQYGYKEEKITITFRKDFTFNDIKRLLVND